MNERITAVLMTPPSQAHLAAQLGLPLAHMAYRVGSGLRLMKTNVRTQTRDAYMALTDLNYKDEYGSAAQLAREIAGECDALGLRGIVADFASPPAEGLVKFIKEAPPILKPYSIKLYTNEAYAKFSTDVCAMVPTNISGGSLRSRLEESITAFGLGRVALDVGRICHDYTLPALENSAGKRLDKNGLSHLISKYRPMVFYSNELCSNYFTYRDEENGMHFVLFDDAHSIAKKLHVARMLGISEAFLLYPEIEDIAQDLISRIQNE